MWASHFIADLKFMPINTRLIFSLKAECSRKFLEWVNYKQSLTDKLRDMHGDAQIELLSQHWVRTDFWSKSLLDVRDHSVFQREILMKSHDIPYWYARTIIPQRCYDLDTEFFGRLRKESVKNLIFNMEQVKRVNSINYPVDDQCVEFYWVKKYIPTIRDVLWVRIAEFSFMEKESFYLVEIMFPELGEITP